MCSSCYNTPRLSRGLRKGLRAVLCLFCTRLQTSCACAVHAGSPSAVLISYYTKPQRETTNISCDTNLCCVPCPRFHNIGATNTLCWCLLCHQHGLGSTPHPCIAAPSRAPAGLGSHSLWPRPAVAVRVYSGCTSDPHYLALIGD